MQSSKFFKKVFLTSGVGALLPLISIAQGDYGLSATAEVAGLTRYGGDVTSIVGNVVGGALSLVGIVFFLLMVYGGVLWMTARGDESRAGKAKDTITAAVIGIIIVFASYALTSFIFSALEGGSGTSNTGATSGNSEFTGTGGSNTNAPRGAACLTDNDCNTTQGCGSTGYCVDICNTNSDCSAGISCVRQLCQSGSLTPTIIYTKHCYQLSPCNDNSECTGGLTCGGPTGDRCGLWGTRDCNTTADCTQQFGGTNWLCN